VLSTKAMLFTLFVLFVNGNAGLFQSPETYVINK